MTPAILLFLGPLTVRAPRPFLRYLAVQRVAEDLVGWNKKNRPGLGIEQDEGIAAMDHVLAVIDLAA